MGEGCGGVEFRPSAVISFASSQAEWIVSPILIGSEGAASRQRKFFFFFPTNQQKIFFIFTFASNVQLAEKKEGRATSPRLLLPAKPHPACFHRGADIMGCWTVRTREGGTCCSGPRHVYSEHNVPPPATLCVFDVTLAAYSAHRRAAAALFKGIARVMFRGSISVRNLLDVWRRQLFCFGLGFCLVFAVLRLLTAQVENRLNVCSSSGKIVSMSKLITPSPLDPTPRKRF